MPVDNDQKLWLDDAKTKGSWLEPVKVTLLSKGKEISTYEYLTYNNIPGTLMLTHATVLNEEGVNVKRNNDGKSFNSNLGNFENKGSLPIYGLYDVNVYEKATCKIITPHMYHSIHSDSMNMHSCVPLRNPAMYPEYQTSNSDAAHFSNHIQCFFRFFTRKCFCFLLIGKHNIHILVYQ